MNALIEQEVSMARSVGTMHAIQIIKDAFATAAKVKTNLAIAYTYDNGFVVYAIEDYGLKLKLLHALEVCHVGDDFLDTAHKELIGNDIMKVLYHESDDTCVSVDREKVIFIHNFK